MLKKYPDLILAILFAAVTSFLVPFSAEAMVESVNWRLLGLLFCLMAIVAGLRSTGILAMGLSLLFRHGVSELGLGRFFIFSCFFASMLITNDVSLIVFVPLALLVLSRARRRGMMGPVVVLQTIAANMGSMLTPIGNPQNLFLYGYFHIGLAAFFSITAPVVLLSGLLLYAATFLFRDTPVTLALPRTPGLPKGRTAWYLCLFLLAILHVLRLLPLTVVFPVVVLSLLALDRRLFAAVDYKLLLLFTFLFIGVGNLDRVEAVRRFAESFVTGHEFWVSLLLSQVISNVPSAVMLAPYTGAYDSLLLGVNIGGLGTLIASMASLISFRTFTGEEGERKKYLGLFTAYNLAFLAILLIWYLAWHGTT